MTIDQFIAEKIKQLQQKYAEIDKIKQEIQELYKIKEKSINS